MNGFGEQVRIVSSLTRSGSSIGQSESIVNAIKMRLEDAGNRVGGTPIVYEDLDGGSEERGSWDAGARAGQRSLCSGPSRRRSPTSARSTRTQRPTRSRSPTRRTLLMISPCNTYPGLTKPFETGRARQALPDRPPQLPAHRAERRSARRVRGAMGAELGAQRVFVLHDTEPCGRGVALPFADACRQLGLELVEPPVGIEPKQSEYEALARTIAESGADLVFYGGIIQNGAGPLWRDVRTRAPSITMMGPDTLFEHAFIQDAGAHAEGTLRHVRGRSSGAARGEGSRVLRAVCRALRTRARVLRGLRLRHHRSDPAGDRARRARRPRCNHAGRFRDARLRRCARPLELRRERRHRLAALHAAHDSKRALRAADRPSDRLVRGSLRVSSYLKSA